MICDTLFVIRAMYLISQSVQLCLNYLANFCHTETFYRIYLIIKNNRFLRIISKLKVTSQVKSIDNYLNMLT